MVQIQPQQIWINGISKTAIYLNLCCVYDNLSDTATFYYQLLTAENISLTDGNLQMNDQDYTNYTTSLDSNKYAYYWSAEKLNLQIINYDTPTSNANSERSNRISDDFWES